MTKRLCLAIILLLLTIACSSAPIDGPAPAAPGTPSSSTPTAPPAVSPAAISAQVLRVVDGDTIQVSMNGRTYTVRYTGIDTPETVHPDKPVQPFGPEASAKNKELVGSRIVRLEKDVSETDRYGRLLRYVYVDGLFVNAELVRLGYAQVATYPPDVKHADLFIRLQREAREAGRGLWAAPPTPTVNQAPATSSPGPTENLSLEILSVTSPVSQGANATLTARTLPGAQCTITVFYKSGASSAAGLEPKTADANGSVSWTWRVGANTTPGSWKIVVTAIIGEEKTSQETFFTVQ
jgi:endonuclease YncB( thermonuclease family)